MSQLSGSINDDMRYLLNQMAPGAVRAVTREVAFAGVLANRLPGTLTRLRLDQIRGTS